MIPCDTHKVSSSCYRMIMRVFMVLLADVSEGKGCVKTTGFCKALHQVLNWRENAGDKDLNVSFHSKVFKFSKPKFTFYNVKSPAINEIGSLSIRFYHFSSVLLFLTPPAWGAFCLSVIQLFISVCYLLTEMGRVFGKFKISIRKGTILLSYSLLCLMEGLKHIFCLAGFKIAFSQPFIQVISPGVDVVFKSQTHYLMCTQNISNCPCSCFKKKKSQCFWYYFNFLFKPFPETFQAFHLPRHTWG